MALLEVRDLRTSFRTDDGVVQAVDGVSFAVERGKTLGIVGESGCGKSVTALSIMRLLPKAGTRISGSVVFEGRDLGSLPEREMQDLRGNRLAMIFQEPMTSLDFLGFGLPPGSASLGELLKQGKANIQAPWLGLAGFFTLAIMLSLLIFIGEAVRAAFDPRKTFR